MCSASSSEMFYLLLTLSHSHLNQRIDLAIDDGQLLWLEPLLERLQRLLCCQMIVLVEKGKEAKKKEEVMNSHDLVRELPKES